MTINGKKIIVSLSAIPVAMSALNAVAEEKRPNILLFMVDDMGWQDTSVPFADSITANNRKYHTPAMERLAASGMKFTSAYASAISSPSRCSLITGMNAVNHKVTNWTLHRDKTTDEPSDIGIPAPDWNYNGISTVLGINNTYVGTSFVQRLKDSGYHTIHCGKAHFGAIDTPGENPAHFGFEVNITGSAAGGLATYLSEKNFGHTPDGKPVSPFAIEGLEKYWGTGTFVTDALTKEAIAALDKAKKYNQPWFLYMSHYAVHVPVDKDMRYYQKYLDQGLSEKEAAYASLVEGMDQSLGELLDWIDENGEADNTIVIFMSDNGGFAASNQWRTGELHTQNAPLRSGKGSLLEGGIREPMIVRWNGHTKPASECSNYLLIEDFYPSILEMAHVELTDSVDGKSFVPMIHGTGNPSEGRALLWNYPHVWGLPGPGIDFSCAMRKDDWKIIYNYITGEKEVYNLAQDPYEHNNLAKANPAQTKKLSAELGNLLRERNAQRPILKSTGVVCPWPDEVN